jgi:hypothetical protein
VGRLRRSRPGSGFGRRATRRQGEGVRERGFRTRRSKVTAATLDEALRAHAARSGVVWYYRENPHAEPHPNADIVVQTIIRHRLPVSMSTKPDFSDALDENRVSRPRK